MTNVDSHNSFSQRNTFQKSERLSSEILIKELFNKGSSFYLFPFKFILRKHRPGEKQVKVLISVPKRNFKKAVDRNLLKRRVREAYRLSKNQFLLPQLDHEEYHLALIYTSKEKLAFDIIEKKLILAFNRLDNNQQNT